MHCHLRANTQCQGGRKKNRLDEKFLNYAADLKVHVHDLLRNKQTTEEAVMKKQSPVSAHYRVFALRRNHHCYRTTGLLDLPVLNSLHSPRTTFRPEVLLKYTRKSSGLSADDLGLIIMEGPLTSKEEKIKW